MHTCLFCTKQDKLYENDHAYVIKDAFPVSTGHLLIIPKRHIQDYFGTTKPEVAAIDQAIRWGKAYLDKHYEPDGYNIGINNGKAAGQTVFHLHIHLIPRYTGDVSDPTGGVRGVIPGKRTY